jgi:hypothetical protein
MRYDNPYLQAPRLATALSITCRSHSLTLDFPARRRVISP